VVLPDIPDEAVLRFSHLRELRRSLIALARTASDQLALFPEDAVSAGRLALEFDRAASTVRGEYDGDLSNAQTGALLAIEQKLATISRDGAEFDPELWTDAALVESVHWADVRRLATAALETFGWLGAEDERAGAPENSNLLS
jgi:hypothetical protein